MGTIGTIWFGRDHPISVNSDGGLWSLGLEAVHRRIEIEKLMDENDLSFNDARKLVASKTAEGYGAFENAPDFRDWEYYISKVGLGITKEEYYLSEDSPPVDLDLELTVDELKQIENEEDFEEKIQETFGAKKFLVTYDLQGSLTLRANNKDGAIEVFQDLPAKEILSGVVEKPTLVSVEEQE